MGFLGSVLLVFVKACRVRQIAKNKLPGKGTETQH